MRRGHGGAFYDSAKKIHYSLQALAENNGSTAASGHSEITFTQQTVISSAAAGGLPNGTSINPIGTMTLTGSWDVTRPSSSENVDGLGAGLGLTLILLRPGLPNETIFDGSIALSTSTFSTDNIMSEQLFPQVTGGATG